MYSIIAPSPRTRKAIGPVDAIQVSSCSIIVNPQSAIRLGPHPASGPAALPLYAWGSALLAALLPQKLSQAVGELLGHLLPQRAPAQSGRRLVGAKKVHTGRAGCQMLFKVPSLFLRHFAVEEPQQQIDRFLTSEHPNPCSACSKMRV